jgi:SOS-response transcriptional repressor LexA
LTGEWTIQKRIDLNDHLIQNKDATHLFRVKGDSMIDAGSTGHVWFHPKIVVTMFV